MDLPGVNGGVTVAPSVYHNGIIESVHEPVKWVHSNYFSSIVFFTLSLETALPEALQLARKLHHVELTEFDGGHKVGSPAPTCAIWEVLRRASHVRERRPAWLSWQDTARGELALSCLRQTPASPISLLLWKGMSVLSGNVSMNCLLVCSFLLAESGYQGEIFGNRTVSLAKKLYAHLRNFLVLNC